MSCKLMMNLVDCIRCKSVYETSTARDLLIIMLRSVTLKFRTVAKIQLPLIMQKLKSSATTTTANGGTTPQTPGTTAIDRDPLFSIGNVSFYLYILYLFLSILY